MSFFLVSEKDQVTGEISVRATCFRSMRKTEKPHSLKVGRQYYRNTIFKCLNFLNFVFI